MFPNSFQDIPQSMRAPLLMQVALAKQANGYRGYGGGTNFDGTPVTRRDIKEGSHLRGLQRRAEMQGISDALHQSRMGNVLESMPVNGQTELMRQFNNKQADATFLDMLNGGAPVDPQLIRNQGLKELWQAGQLSQDAPGMSAITPTTQHQWDLEMGGALSPAGTTVNVGAGAAPQTIEQQAADAVLKSRGEKTEWEASQLGQGLKRQNFFGQEREPAPNPSIDDAVQSLNERFSDQLAGRQRDLPTITPEFIQSLRAQYPPERLKQEKYDPAPQKGFLSGLLDQLNGPDYGRQAFNLILSKPNLTPAQLEAEMRTLKRMHDSQTSWLPGMTGEFSPPATPAATPAPPSPAPLSAPPIGANDLLNMMLQFQATPK